MNVDTQTRSFLCRLTLHSTRYWKESSHLACTMQTSYFIKTHANTQFATGEIFHLHQLLRSSMHMAPGSGYWCIAWRSCRSTGSVVGSSNVRPEPTPSTGTWSKRWTTIHTGHLCSNKRQNLLTPPWRKSLARRKKLTSASSAISWKQRLRSHGATCLPKQPWKEAWGELKLVIISYNQLIIRSST